MVLLIHSETVWLLAFAAASIAFKSSGRKRTGTIRPFASPFGSLGRPTLLAFFGWGKGSELLHNCSAHSVSRRLDGMRMQNRKVTPGFRRIVSFVRPSVNERC